jgi:hypothetical protein
MGVQVMPTAVEGGGTSATGAVRKVTSQMRALVAAAAAVVVVMVVEGGVMAVVVEGGVVPRVGTVTSAESRVTGLPNAQRVRVAGVDGEGMAVAAVAVMEDVAGDTRKIINVQASACSSYQCFGRL